MENNNEKRIKLTWNKKVISISFLVLALFMLLAVSYAYFTAKVEGNEDAESITVEAAKMSLKLTGPTEVSLPNALPGTEVKSEFTVTNTGTVQTTYNLDMIDVENTFVDKGDLVYNITSTNDGGHAENVIAPTTSQTLIRNILIQPGEDNAQVYTLTVRFRETGVDQNSNQGKKFTGRIQINNLEDKSLAATILRANPIQSSDDIDFKKGSPYCESTNICTNPTDNGNGLYAAADNDGTSYYFRGDINKINNNVRFADKKWQIIRINGDGSVRLILYYYEGKPASMFNEYTYSSETPQHEKVGFTTNNDIGKECTNEHPCEVTYDKAQNEFSNEKFGGDNSDIKTALETWYKNNLTGYDDQIVYGLFCNDVSYGHGTDDMSTTEYLYYGAYERIDASGKNYGNPTLICPEPNKQDGTPRLYGGLYKTKIGLITADEMNMAGFGNNENGNYLTDNLALAWGLSPIYSHYYAVVAFFVNGTIQYNSTFTEQTVVPVINLKSDVAFTGTGTEDDPYIIAND